MNSINIYYKRIIEKFGKSAKIEEENTIAPTISQLEELPIDSSLSLDTKASQYDSDSMAKKRNLSNFTILIILLSLYFIWF